MISDPNLRKSIIASIIASLCVILFIQPVLNTTWEFIEWVSGNIYTELSSQVYLSTALGNRDHISYSMLVIIVGMMSGLATGLALRKYKLKKSPKERAKPTLWKRVIPDLLATCLLIGGLSLLSFIHADLQMNTSFNQRLNALAPYIDEQQEEVLFSEWAFMKSKSDYKRINESMDKMAEEKGIVLPKLISGAEL